MALILALLKSQLCLFYDRPEGNGAWESQKFNFTETKLSIVAHPHSCMSRLIPVRVSENSFSHDIVRSSLPIATIGDEESSPPITEVHSFFLAVYYPIA